MTSEISKFSRSAVQQFPLRGNAAILERARKSNLLSTPKASRAATDDKIQASISHAVTELTSDSDETKINKIVTPLQNSSKNILPSISSYSTSLLKIEPNDHAHRLQIAVFTALPYELSTIVSAYYPNPINTLLENAIKNVKSNDELLLAVDLLLLRYPDNPPTVLDLSGHLYLNDDTLKALFKKLSLLEEVNLKDCQNITTINLPFLLQKLKSINLTNTQLVATADTPPVGISPIIESLMTNKKVQIIFSTKLGIGDNDLQKNLERGMLTAILKKPKRLTLKDPCVRACIDTGSWTPGDLICLSYSINFSLFRNEAVKGLDILQEIFTSKKFEINQPVQSLDPHTLIPRKQLLTPLAIACLDGIHERIVQALLVRDDIDVNVCDVDGNTALDHLNEGQQKIIKFYIANPEKRSPELVAAHNNNFEAVKKLLIAQGAKTAAELQAK